MFAENHVIAKMLRLIVVGLAFVLLICYLLWPRSFAFSESDADRQWSQKLSGLALREPSGICYHKGRDSLFIVGDQGDIAEISTSGDLINRRKHSAMDFEGISYVPQTGLLYAAQEGKDNIIELDPQTLLVLKTYDLSRKYKGKKVLKRGGDGLEGISFVPDLSHPQGGTFFVVNQSLSTAKKKEASAIIRVELPLRKPLLNSVNKKTAQKDDTKKTNGTPRDGKKYKGIITDYRASDVIDLSGLFYDETRKILYVISDTKNLLMTYDLKLQKKSSEPLPGKNQEGIAADTKGYLYIAQDDGKIIRRRWSSR